MDVCNTTPSRYLIASRRFEETGAFIFNGLEFRTHASRYSRPLTIKALSPFETSGSAYPARRRHIQEERHHCDLSYCTKLGYLHQRLDTHCKSVAFTTGADQLATDAKPTVHPRSHGLYTRQTFVTCDYLSRGRNGSLVQTGRPTGHCPFPCHWPSVTQLRPKWKSQSAHIWHDTNVVTRTDVAKHCLTFRTMNARGPSKRRQPLTQWQTQRHIRNIRAAVGSAAGTRCSICSACCGPLRCSQVTQGLLHSPGRHSATDYNCRSADTPDEKKPCKNFSLTDMRVTTNAYVNRQKIYHLGFLHSLNWLVYYI